MATALHELSFVEYEDLVGGFSGGQPVGDHQRCAMRHDTLERVLHERLRASIEVRCRLIEDQHRRVVDQRAGEPDPLAVAPGQDPDRAARDVGEAAAIDQPGDAVAECFPADAVEPSELEQSFDIHAAEGSFLGGIHFELTGENVTECMGGARGLAETDLARAYESRVDPRLNYEQALEMALLVARRMARLNGRDF